MISYSTNLMGPFNIKWYEERNVPKGVQYCCGRIDIRDSLKEGYDGWYEYGLPPMASYSWSELSNFLDHLETEELITYSRLIEMFEQMTRHKIEWYEEGKYES